MRNRRVVTLAAVLIVAAVSQLVFAQSKSAPSAADELRTARLAWGSDPAKRCPELRQSVAPDGAVAVVQLMVGATGAPSQASVRSSSGSSGFDAAAMSCVLKLHFLPATRAGDGVAIESWQQMALKWEGPVGAPQSARCEAAGSPVVVADARESAAGRGQPGPAVTRAGVCVCVDETGKITQPPVLMTSSGIADFDKAALELSSAAHYRPATSASGQPAAGCFRFKVGIEMK